MCLIVRGMIHAKTFVLAQAAQVELLASALLRNLLEISEGYKDLYGEKPIVSVTNIYIQSKETANFSQVISFLIGSIARTVRKKFSLIKSYMCHSLFHTNLKFYMLVLIVNRMFSYCTESDNCTQSIQEFLFLISSKVKKSSLRPKKVRKKWPKIKSRQSVL